MKLIDDATVRRLLDPAAAREAVDRALRHFADGQAAVQARVRTVAGPVKLSTMAAVDLGGRVAGAKVYTTIAGRFRFVVLLFDAESGAPLAVLESDAMTEVRTAAVTAVAARALARADADTLAVFGTGIQAGSHVRALAGALPVRQVRVVSRGDARDFCRRMAEATGLPVEQAGTRAALDGAGLVVTATRSATPLFGLDQLAPGAFVAAVGSTLPGHAEIGADVIGAARVVVEWLPQAREEAGDLLLAAEAGAFSWDSAVELGAILTGRAPGRTRPDEIFLFESVGIGLEDVACAAEVWNRLSSERT